MYKIADRVDPDAYRHLCAALFTEMLTSGITTVGEFHYLHRAPGGAGYDNENAMGEAIIDAAGATGIRLTLIDACYLHGGIGEELAGAQLRFGDGSVDAWAGRVSRLEPGENVKVGIAVHSVRSLVPDEITAVAEFAVERGDVLHFHLSEQLRENEQCQAAYGVSPTELLSDSGCLGPRSVAVHATHCSEKDVALLGASASAACLCPTTERELGDGVGPGQALRTAGSQLCVGSDSNAVVDLFEEARAIELDERMVTTKRGIHDPASLLSAATANGARALGWPEVGRIEVGAQCDLVAISLDSPRLAGLGKQDLIPGVVFSSSPADVTDVVVGGRHLVERGVHRVVGDVAPALSAAIAAVREPR